MVRPTVVVKGTKSAVVSKKALSKGELVTKFVNDKAFQNKILLNTANHRAKKYSLNEDINFKGVVNPTGKSLKLDIDGKETKAYYSFCGTGSNAFLISSKAFRR